MLRNESHFLEDMLERLGNRWGGGMPDRVAVEQAGRGECPTGWLGNIVFVCVCGGGVIPDRLAGGNKLGEGMPDRVATSGRGANG